ncbi:MAG: tetratricopeptide repeat protein [Anaerolineales bacterium]|nr:tetratricopeptide repeat protein [Anaerolineales bacterium]
MFAPSTKRLPWTLFFFIPILYFTLFDQPGFIPSARTFSIYLVLLIFAPWLGVKVWRRQPLIYTPLDSLLLLIIVLYLVSAFLSPSPRLTFYSLWLLLLSILTFYLMLDQFRAGREKALWQAIFLVVAIVLELAALEFLAWYLGLFPLLGFEISWPEVAGWTLPPNPRRLGLALLTVPVAPPFSAYVALFIPLALGLALSTRKFSVRLGFAGFIFLSLIILLLTFSRTGWVTLAVGLLSLGALSLFKPLQARLQSGLQARSISTFLFEWSPKVWTKKWTGLFMGVIVASFLIIPFLNQTHFIEEVFKNREGSNQIRLSLIQAAVRMWLEHPLLGIGPGLFGPFYRDYIPPNSFFLLSLSTHSFYFQMLAEVGLAGLGMAALIFLAATKAAYQRLMGSGDTSQRWRVIGVAATLIGYFTSAAIEQLWWPAFIIPIAAMAAYLFYQPPQAVEVEDIPLSERVEEKPRSKLNFYTRLRTWLPGIYLFWLLVFGAALIYTNAVANRFAQLTAAIKPGQTLQVAQEISQLQRSDPGLPMYPVAQAHYLGQHVIETLDVTPCTNPPLHIPEPEKQRLENAVDLYQQGLQSIKGHPLYWANLAALYWLNHQPDEAQAALAQAINLTDTGNPNLEIYLLNSGCYYELQGNASAALAAYGSLLARNPSLVGSAFWQDSPFRKENFSQMIDPARQHLADPQQEYLVAIEIELAQNKLENAAKSIERFIAAFPDSPDALRLQAENWLSQGKYQESQALAAQIGDYQLLGQIALAQGDLALAETQFKKAIFIKPDDPQARFGLAQIALRQGDTARAIAHLQKIALPYAPPITSDSKFIYGYSTNFSLYNSLLIIASPPLQGQPFHLLAQLYQESGQADLAAEAQQALSTYDSYLKN